MDGFSLVEMAMFLMIAGLLMSASIEIARAFNKVKPITVTRDHYTNIQTALEMFLAQYGRLPCPSLPELDTDDLNGGKEECSVDLLSENTASGWVIPSCDNTKTSDNGSGLCYTLGRDSDTNSQTTSDILIGMVPYATIGLDAKYTLDGYGDKIKYIVTKSLTTKETYDTEEGAIYIAHPSPDTSYRTPPNPDLPSPTNALAPYPLGSAQIVLLSYGENRVGKYVYGADKNLSGSYKCDASSDSSTGFGLDFENCNNDMYVFNDEKYSLATANITYPLGSLYKAFQYFYDDIVHPNFAISPFSDGYWAYTGQVVSPGVPASTRNLVLSGRVGIGTQHPRHMLHVGLGEKLHMGGGGDIRAHGVYADKFCGVSGTDCFSPAIIGGEGMKCGNNDPLVGIVGGKPVCGYVSNGTPATCPQGKAMDGINAGTGAISCH